MAKKIYNYLCIMCTLIMLLKLILLNCMFLLLKMLRSRNC